MGKSRTTVKIVKTSKGYEVIKTTKDYFTNYKPKYTNLGTFNTKAEAIKTQKTARRLMGKK